MSINKMETHFIFIKLLPEFCMSWKSWRQRNPNTLVLSTQTGYGRNYAIDPYEGYYSIGGLMFPVGRIIHILKFSFRLTSEL